MELVEDDDIDPAWWAPAFADENLHEYEPAELLSSYLAALAKQEGIDEFQRGVLETLAAVSSAMLRPDDWLAPFTPAMQFGDRRSLVPSDLSTGQIAMLARVAPLVERADLRSRVADVAWFYGDRSNVALCNIAIDAYRAAPLTSYGWASIGRDAWRRAFELARRRGMDGQARADEMTEALRARILAGSIADQFSIVGCSELLRQEGRVAGDSRREIAEHLMTLATEARTLNPRLARQCEREVIAWLGNKNDEEVYAAGERIARTYLAEADARVAGDTDDGVMVEGLFLEKAIAAFRPLPRSYRVAHGIEDLIARLRERLQASREMTLENMVRLPGESIDLSDAISYARESVSGHSDRGAALTAFVKLSPPMDAERVRANAEEALEGP